MLSLLAALWLASGILLYYINNDRSPSEEDTSLLIQGMILCLGPVCWTFIIVIIVLMNYKKQIGEEHGMEYYTSWKIFVLCLVPWFAIVYTLLLKFKNF